MSAPNAKLSAETGTVRRLRTVIRGAVQGVGFRPFIYRLATEMGLPGWVINSAQGVFIEVDGAEPKLREFLARVEREKPAISYIQSIESSFLDAAGFVTFEIRESSGGEKTALILPDLSTCPDCMREVRDRANRRYRYPFTNCTNCGPRFTIIESLPYDRPRTTMKKFSMCAECKREYHDPANRRFHAQPNACPVCGPQLEWWDARGAKLARGDEALRAAAEAIRNGSIVAVKGLGGFHLVVDASNEDAVTRLRKKKRREEKPFALMMPSFDVARESCDISAEEARMLRSVESPIVLVKKRSLSFRTSDAEIAASIAPGNPYFGVMLPYTPLHWLLMEDLGFPVVATSGNLSNEPICTDEHESLDRLRGIAEWFLVHDRPILRHVDDSIVREMNGCKVVLRRARGFAPLPVTLAEQTSPLLAVGAHQKNSVAIAVGRQVFVSQHIGDLETAQALQAFEQVIGGLETLYELEPEAVACDMHPGYLSTQFAQRSGRRTVAVQHHYAHALSCMAENDLRPPVLAVTWDGSGYGPDGTVWGGEFLRVSEDGFERVAHLRTFCLPGGEKAVKQPRRVALAVLYEIFGDAAFDQSELDPVRAFSAEELRLLRSMLVQNVNSPRTSSAGRLFDAAASLIGLRQVCGFEGQAAMELEFAIGGELGGEAYEFRIEGERPMVIDWAPMVRQILKEKDRRRVPLRFHQTLVEMMVAVAERVGEKKVVFSGGCFQNKFLSDAAGQAMSRAGFQPYFHQRVPPNDGGICLGQIVAATKRRV